MVERGYVAQSACDNCAVATVFLYSKFWWNCSGGKTVAHNEQSVYRDKNSIFKVSKFCHRISDEKVVGKFQMVFYKVGIS